MTNVVLNAPFQTVGHDAVRGGRRAWHPRPLAVAYLLRIQWLPVGPASVARHLVRYDPPDGL